MSTNEIHGWHSYCGCGFTAGRPLSNEAACGYGGGLISKNGILTADIIHNDDDDDLVSAPNNMIKIFE